MQRILLNKRRNHVGIVMHARKECKRIFYQFYRRPRPRSKEGVNRNSPLKLSVLLLPVLL